MARRTAAKIERAITQPKLYKRKNGTYGFRVKTLGYRPAFPPVLKTLTYKGKKMQTWHAQGQYISPKREYYRRLAMIQRGEL